MKQGERERERETEKDRERERKGLFEMLQGSVID